MRKYRFVIHLRVRRGSEVGNQLGKLTREFVSNFKWSRRVLSFREFLFFISDQVSRYNMSKIIQEKMSDTDLFMDKFDPVNSNREKRKKMRSLPSNEGGNGKKRGYSDRYVFNLHKWAIMMYQTILPLQKSIV